MSNSDQTEVITVLQKMPLSVFMDSGPTDAQRNDVIRVLLLWNLALHWVIKLKWQSNYKIPYPRNLALVMKPLGMVIYRSLELCIQCHSFLENNPYPTAAEWFAKIVRESQCNTISRPRNTGKTESLKIRREFINSIVEGKNPISEQIAPHEWRLMETALFSNLGDNFDKEYLQSYIKSYRHWLNATKSANWNAVIQQNNELFVQLGQGKGKILLDFQHLFPNQ